MAWRRFSQTYRGRGRRPAGLTRRPYPRGRERNRVARRPSENDSQHLFPAAFRATLCCNSIRRGAGMLWSARLPAACSSLALCTTGRARRHRLHPRVLRRSRFDPAWMRRQACPAVAASVRVTAGFGHAGKHPCREPSAWRLRRPRGDLSDHPPGTRQGFQLQLLIRANAPRNGHRQRPRRPMSADGRIMRQGWHRPVMVACPSAITDNPRGLAIALHVRTPVFNRSQAA